MKFYNAFGIKPTNSFTSAGSDYYIPNLDTKEKKNLAYKTFEKSYKKTTEEITRIHDTFEFLLTSENETSLIKHIPNMVQLYLSLYNLELEGLKENTNYVEAVTYFLDECLVYDFKNDKVGVKLNLNDTLFINSGIKIALDTVLSDKDNDDTQDIISMLRSLGIGVAGLYVNKSGMGNKGFDIRACLVDEDYSGFVHLSVAYTKDVFDNGENIVYCGDKLTQMMLIPIFHDEYIDTDEETYNKIMANSQRGDKGFGSQDVKH